MPRVLSRRDRGDRVVFGAILAVVDRSVR